MNTNKTIFKVEVKSDFTKVPNTILRDKNLSYGARGMLSMVFSLDESSIVSRDILVLSSNEPKNRIKNFMRELERNGYVYYQIRSISGGGVKTFVTFHYPPIKQELRSNITNW